MKDVSENEELNPNEQNIKELKCSSCGAIITKVDTFCGDCGSRVKVTELPGAVKMWDDEVTASVNKASKWVFAIGIMFIVFGTFLGFMQKKTTDEAIANLVGYENSMTWSVPVNGKTVTVGELKRMIWFEYYGVFGINYFLAIVMLVIFKWSKTSPFSAFVTALSIYAGVIVLNAIIDPTTIIQGVIIKILVIGALIKGIKAAIPTRGLKRA